MIRRSGLAASALLALALVPAAGAQSPMASQAPLVYPPPPVSMTSNVVLAKDVPVVPMAEWKIVQKGQGEQSGARVLIAAGDKELGRAPPEAVRYESQSFHFPSGQVRVLKFRKASGGVLHQVTTETQLYVASGSAVVGVNGTPTEIFAGDVASLPSGLLESRPARPRTPPWCSTPCATPVQHQGRAGARQGPQVDADHRRQGRPRWHQGQRQAPRFRRQLDPPARASPARAARVR